MKLPRGLQEDIDITHLSAFKTPARTHYFYDITEGEEALALKGVYDFAKKHNIPIVIIGAGTNCLFAFDVFEGIIIRNRNMGWEDLQNLDGQPFVPPFTNGTDYQKWSDIPGYTYVRVHSGELSNNIAMKLYTNYGISTLVPWIGLPGTFGGATIGNAGCFGVEMEDIFLEADVLDLETGEICRFLKADMHFSYRNSILKGNPRFFVLSTRINLTPLCGEYESYTPENLRSIRKVKQPAGFSCGSFFANPPELSAGRLIDEAGLKGTRVGGVKISEQHGNFFINDQKATWRDIITLRDQIKNVVREKYNIELHEEVRIIYNNIHHVQV